jgi:parvulin-like peptidyl-prolyl isomerase
MIIVRLLPMSVNCYWFRTGRHYNETVILRIKFGGNSLSRKSIIPLFLLVCMLLSTSVVSAQGEYEIPVLPDADPDMIIGQVGDEIVTLEMFWQRVRYSRLQTFDFLIGLAEERGEAILDLANPENQFAPSVQAFLGQTVDEVRFGEQAYNIMILDLLYHQEAQARAIEVTECQMNEAWINLLQMPPITECELPENFEAVRDAHVNNAVIFAGMTPEQVSRIVVSQAEAAAVRESLASELDAPTEPLVRTRHIRVETLELANEALEKLQAGEDFEAVLQEYTIDTSVFGNGGDLGEFERGMMVEEFENAAFSAEVGEIVGPVQTQFGFHVLEVLDQREEEQVCARHILLSTLEEANAAIRLINDGRDFADLAVEYSEDPGSRVQGGALGCFGPGVMVPAFDEAVFSAEIGEVIGPVETEFGFHVIEVTERGPQSVAVHVRHILVGTQEEAEAVLERLADGEDFAELARELSTDPSAKPLGMDTMAIATGGREEGFYGLGELLPEFDAVFEAELGDYVGPIETEQFGVFIFEIQEISSRESAQAGIVRQAYVLNWEDEQLDTDRVQTTDLWRAHVPIDPRPGDVYESLAGLDEAFDEAHAAYLARREANLIPNVLRSLQLPEPQDTSDAESGGDGSGG